MLVGFKLLNLECADMSALWSARHVAPSKSGVMPTQSKSSWKSGGTAPLNLECADTSAHSKLSGAVPPLFQDDLDCVGMTPLFEGATCRADQSADMSAHSKLSSLNPTNI